MYLYEGTPQRALCRLTFSYRKANNGHIICISLLCVINCVRSIVMLALCPTLAKNCALQGFLVTLVLSSTTTFLVTTLEEFVNLVSSLLFHFDAIPIHLESTGAQRSIIPQQSTAWYTAVLRCCNSAAFVGGILLRYLSFWASSVVIRAFNKTSQSLKPFICGVKRRIKDTESCMWHPLPISRYPSRCSWPCLWRTTLCHIQ